MVSVIVPVYNVETYLNRCVESIVKQNYKDLEIILVDDGSTDRCGEMCDKWAQKDDRIKVIHKKNGGLSDARNAGIEAATGEYIGFVDSDDWIEPDMYQDLVDAIEREGVEFAVTGIKRIYDNGYSRVQFERATPCVIAGDSIIQEYLRQGTFSTAAWDKLYVKSLFDIRRFPVGRQYEDAPVIFDILCNIQKLAIVGKAQYNYFQRADGITGKAFSIRKMDHFAFSKEIRDRVYKDYPKYKGEADVFWGCKMVEILYALYESDNRKCFSQEQKMLYEELKHVWWDVMKSKSVPFVVRLKTGFAYFHMEWFIILIKKMKAARK